MNIIAFRSPDSDTTYIYKTGAAEKINLETGELRFVISPFNNKEKGFQYILTEKITEIPNEVIETNDIKRYFKISDYPQYREYIEYIKKYISGDENKKVVASRREIVVYEAQITTLFNQLCKEYPDAYVFFISTKEYGNWIGASPELLLEKKGDILTTMSLAGTRKSGSDSPWDLKNLKEQQIVTDFIKNTFQKFGFNAEIKKRDTRKAGKIEHLVNIIESKIINPQDVDNLLKELSPTPALSGFPKKEAIEIINNFEGDRSLYGGFMGPVFPNGDFRFNVILRCACLSPTTATLFAGGGITYLSDPEEEWEETEKKLDTIRRLL